MKQLLAILAFLMPVLAFGQGSGMLKQSSKISSGSLPNGVSYYLVQNGYSKSHADFALVQKGNLARETAHEALGRLAHFGDVKPYEYLASKGVGYTVSGLASYSPSGVVYRFQNVPVDNPAVSDSLLLMVFDLMQTYPSEQAVIISGDIAPAKILDRLHTLSMMVSPRDSLEGQDEFAWEPCDSIIFECSEILSDRMAVIDATYYTKRIPREDMGTVQPMIVRMFARETGTLAERRIRSVFKKAGIPIGSLNLHYRGSDESVEQERYSVSLTVDRDQLAQATSLLGSVAASLDSVSIRRSEFNLIKNRNLMEAWKRLPAGSGSNPAYVNKCISSYLFGAALAEDSALNEFYSNRTLPPDTERQLLGDYMSSIFDRDKNLILHYSSPDLLFCRDSLVEAFHRGWDAELESPGIWRSTVDTSKMALPLSKAKVKLKLSSPDVLSGGQIWTFSNGLRVLYKKDGSRKGRFEYGFLFCGGVAGSESFVRGELPFANDMLRMYDVAGIKASDFSEYLASRGIDMKSEIGLSDFRITGSAPTNSLTTLFKAMYALSTSRSFNREDFEYYKSCQYLLFEENMRSRQGIVSLMGQVAYPDYRYTDHKIEKYLNDGIPSKTGKFIGSKLSNWSNGLIVIVGDVDEYALKEYLVKTLGAFPSGRVTNPRGRAEKRLNQGRTVLATDSETAVVGGTTPSVNLRLTAQVPYNQKRAASLELGMEVLRGRLVRALSSQGMYIFVDGSFDLQPIETVTLDVSCIKCTGAGLPAGVGPADVDYAIMAVRRVLDEMVSSPAGESELKVIRDRSLNFAKARVGSPSVLVDAVMTRYSQGRDLLGGYEAALKEVKGSDIAELMRTLQGGTHIEYLVR